jgi:RNA polymerase sigma factor (TIGR02999 family)
MLQERRGHTMQPTELIAELYLTLATRHAVKWQNRSHFKAVAANTMRRIVIDYARRAGTRKRTRPVDPNRPMVDPERAAGWDYYDQLLWIDELLDILAGHNARVADVFICHYFGGMSLEEIGDAFSLHPKTMMRDYKYAKEWLKLKLENKRVYDGMTEKQRYNEVLDAALSLDEAERTQFLARCAESEVPAVRDAILAILASDTPTGGPESRPRIDLDLYGESNRPEFGSRLPAIQSCGTA